MKSRMKNVLLTIVTTVCAAVVGSSAAHATAEPEHVEPQSAASTQSQAVGRGQRMTALVEVDLRNAQRLQARGDITAARNSAIRAWLGANIAHSIPTTSNQLNPVLLFPEGDALHFFAWNTATEPVYIDLSQDSVKLAWRASMEPPDPAGVLTRPTKVNAPYAFVREEILVHEDGARPEITKPLVFFEVEYNTFGGLLYGRVTPSGDFIALGRDGLTWRYYDGGDGTGSKRAITRVRGQWLAWSKVCSIPGERDGFAKLDQQPAGPVAVSNAGQAFARLAHQYLAKGDLTAARNAALAAWGHAGIPGSRVGHGDALEEDYLFPEGQALRFFDWNEENRLTYIEIRGDSVPLVWAADLVGSDRQLPDGRIVSWPSNLMPRVPYKFASGSRITLEAGRRPDTDGALVFFALQFATGGMPFGRVAADGSLRPTGAGELKLVDGHYQVSPIPDERIAAPVDRARQGQQRSGAPSELNTYQAARLTDETDCLVYGMSSPGQVVGAAITAGSGGSYTACSFANGLIRDYGAGRSSNAICINSKGEAVGEAHSHAALYSGGQIQDLGTLGGRWSRAKAINDAGQIVGYSLTGVLVEPAPGLSTVQQTHAFLWSNGKMRDLDSSNSKFSEAFAINSRGLAVGEEGGNAVLWQAGKALSLNRLVTPPIPTLNVACCINDCGEIVAKGDLSGHNRYYLLKPMSRVRHK